MHRAKNNQAILTNEKDECNEPGKVTANQGRKGKTKVSFAATVAGLCEAGSSFSLLRFSRRGRNGDMGFLDLSCVNY